MKRNDDDDFGLRDPPVSDAGAASASNDVTVLQS